MKHIVCVQVEFWTDRMDPVLCAGKLIDKKEEKKLS